MSNRREFITVLGGAAVAWPLAARGQHPAMPVVGFLSGRSPNDSVANVIAFQRGLGELGYFDGQNVEIDFRWALSHYDQLPALARVGGATVYPLAARAQQPERMRRI